MSLGNCFLWYSCVWRGRIVILSLYFLFYLSFILDVVCMARIINVSIDFTFIYSISQDLDIQLYTHSDGDALWVSLFFYSGSCAHSGCLGGGHCDAHIHDNQRLIYLGCDFLLSFICSALGGMGITTIVVFTHNWLI